MRRLATATVSAAVASLLLLTGCAGSDAGDTSTPSPSASEATEAAPAGPTAEDVAALDAVTVEGEAGAEPTLAFEQPFEVSAAVARVVSEGTGAALEDGQMLSMSVVEVSGEDGSPLNSTYGGAPFELQLGGTRMPPIIGDILAGQAVGVRVLLASPSPEATILTALEVTDARTVPTRAEGTPVEPAAGLPTITLAENGAPSIEPVTGEPPTELVVQPLITGAGPAVESGQSVTAHYTGWLWDGTQFDSSWDRGEASTFSLEQVIAGWGQGLVGQTVGSQVLLVIPPELGYGDAEQNAIPANSTLVFVVDILAAS
ncbi:FKBP-type peptidyl-prolyl cis-trans isomerase [Cellulomonas sp. ATA003]|uniref:FKBP-type peptidyl-prolyl cis-trans isomerase n=1 Tax=Cellulomonas sp. ATA003 TaxID=3073064 RepID=UPI002872D779|nr:FKBP-type peptidyl-prolyl cis-trans isomerase [Cellulomonas sp. ATA003]WNB85516.1 FKBP-type peptidyl-prolyl cis-trans isomerase [Cellulomonas sp. ATA003]